MRIHLQIYSSKQTNKQKKKHYKVGVCSLNPGLYFILKGIYVYIAPSAFAIVSGIRLV